MARKPPPNRNPSSGTIALVEDQNGGVRLVVELDEVEGTDSATFARIKSGIAGLSYLYDQDAENIMNIGKAFVDGMDEGFKRGRKTSEDKKNRSSNYKGANIGFHSKEVKDEGRS